jgi:hypothetical protein
MFFPDSCAFFPIRARFHFEAVGKLYERAKAAANITEPVAYEIQADEELSFDIRGSD